MKNISIFISSRAEYFPCKKLIKEIHKSKCFNLTIILGGSILNKKFINIKNEFKNLDYNIKKLNFVMPKNTVDTLHSSYIDIIKKTSVFLNKNKIRNLLIIGDRYEAFLFSIVAKNYGVRIIHISGGEKTLGSLDNVYRNAISNLSDIHFPSLNIYKKQLVNLGIDNKNIFPVGEIGLSYLDNCSFLTKKIIEQNLNFKFFKKNILITYHPNSVNYNETKLEIEILLESLKNLKNIGLIFTFSNSDLGHDIINKSLSNFVSKNINNSILVNSLGDQMYRSVLKHVDAVIGNSSSGIWEVPSFKIPTLNIGDRQKGRYKPNSVIDCPFNKKLIIKNINMIINYPKYKKKFTNPYYKRNTILKIIKVLKSF